MKKRVVALTAVMLLAILCFGGCSLPWDHGGKENETVTPPQTSTVAGAEAAKRAEPAADAVYERYAAVRIDAVAGIRLYVDVRKAEPVVVGVQALNKKGESLLADFDLQDMAYEEAMRQLAERLISTGTVNAFYTNVTITAEQNGPSAAAAEKLEETARDVFSDIYKQHGLEALFAGEGVSVGE